MHKSRAHPHAVIHACSHWTLHPAYSLWAGGLAGIRGLVHFGWRWGEKDSLHIDFDVLNFLFFKLKLLPSVETEGWVCYAQSHSYMLYRAGTNTWHLTKCLAHHRCSTGSWEMMQWKNANFTLKTSHLDKINSLLTVPVLSTFGPLSSILHKRTRVIFKKKKKKTGSKIRLQWWLLNSINILKTNASGLIV